MLEKIKQIYQIMISIATKARMAIWRFRLNEMSENVYIARYVVIYQPSKLTIKKNVKINEFVHIWAGGEVEIGENTLVAAGVSITSVTHDSYAKSKGLNYNATRITGPIKIGNNVWIGTNSVIFPGVEIGDNSIIGAGSVVKKSVDENTIVAGVPAVFIRKI